MNGRSTKRQAVLCLAAGLLTLVLWDTASADVVTDWNQNLIDTLVAVNASPLVSFRAAAIVQVAVFDAVNGIKPRYAAIHMDSNGPRKASRDAAAVQASYATLVALFPSQQAALDAKREEALAAIALEENSRSIERGIAWGQEVADAILQWRSRDGFTPPPFPFLGGTAVGQWRPTEPDFLPGAGLQFSAMEPWAITFPSRFRPAGPPALTSDQYTTDFNEVKEIGRIDSATRTAEQTEIALFWGGNAGIAWNRVATSVILASESDRTTVENARLLAHLNIAMADAIIACWDAKYRYVTWRPITAIRLADTDGNPATAEDPSWEPLLVTPPHPDYPSGHSTISGAAATVLATSLGDETAFTLTSETLPGVTRSYARFTGAADEANAARVYAGIHFRFACVDGRTAGDAIGNLVMANVAQARND
jgi:hypothetical protein